MTDTTVAPTGGTGATGGTPATTPWYGANADPTFVGHLQNRGWDKLEPSAAAVAAATAHREAEKLIGGRAEDRVVWPKDAADSDGWNRVNSKLGVPSDVKEYDFSGVKFSDGTAIDDELANTLRAELQKARVSKTDAPAFVKSLVAIVEKQETAAEADYQANLTQEREKLRINWGANVDPFLTIARNTATTLGVTPEQVDALEKQIGYAAVMEMFRNIGQKIGEDQFVTSNNGGGGKPQPMTFEQASFELDRLTNDATFYAKLAAGDTASVKQFDNLTRLVAAGQRR
jgi:hypothetical protein